MIHLGIAELAIPNPKAARLWKRTTGFEVSRMQHLPLLTAEDCYALQKEDKRNGIFRS